MLRAGLIGLGQIGRHHARVLHSLEGVELVGVADPAPDPADHPALGQIPLVASVDALIELGLDLAIVATPTATHLEIGRRLAAAEIPTLIEKPAANTAAEVADLRAAFDGHGVLGCVGHIERFNPAIREMRTRLQHGFLGDLYQVATRRQGPFPTHADGIGVVLDLATHDLDLTPWVTGRDYTSLTAHTAHRTGRGHEDLVAILGRLGGGVVTDHLVNWLSPLKERMVMVNGERGTLIADTLTADLTYYANGAAPVEWDPMQAFRGVVQGDVVRFAFPKAEPLALELQCFRDAVLGHGGTVVTLAEAEHAVALAQAVLDSDARGETVHVSPSDAFPR